MIERIIEDEKRVTFESDDTFLRSYPEFISYFQGIRHIERHHLIIAANFTYGWMPTMLRFKSRDFETAVEVLNQAKQGQLVDENELGCFVKLINNSLVGASKLLHFANPELYSIWDSRVYRYLFGNVSLLQLNKPRNYLGDFFQ